MNKKISTMFIDPSDGRGGVWHGGCTGVENGGPV